MQLIIVAVTIQYRLAHLEFQYCTKKQEQYDDRISEQWLNLLKLSIVEAHCYALQRRQIDCEHLRNRIHVIAHNQFAYIVKTCYYYAK